MPDKKHFYGVLLKVNKNGRKMREGIEEVSLAYFKIQDDSQKTSRNFVKGLC